jgi:hypothetical protein
MRRARGPAGPLQSSGAIHAGALQAGISGSGCSRAGLKSSTTAWLYYVENYFSYYVLKTFQHQKTTLSFKGRVQGFNISIYFQIKKMTTTMLEHNFQIFDVKCSEIEAELFSKLKTKLHYRKLKIKMNRLCRVGTRGYIVLFIPWGGG